MESTSIRKTFVENMDCLETIALACEGVTQHAIDYAAAKMKPKEDTDTVIGTVHNETCKRLYVAIDHFQAQDHELKAKALRATSDEEKAIIKSQRTFADISLQVCQQLFWFQVKTDMGDWEPNMCLRSGWQVVRMKDDSAFKRGHRLLAAGVGLEGLGQVLNELMQEHADGED